LDLAKYGNFTVQGQALSGTGDPTLPIASTANKSQMSEFLILIVGIMSFY